VGSGGARCDEGSVLCVERQGGGSRQKLPPPTSAPSGEKASHCRRSTPRHRGRRSAGPRCCCTACNKAPPNTAYTEGRCRQCILSCCACHLDTGTLVCCSSQDATTLSKAVDCDGSPPPECTLYQAYRGHTGRRLPRCCRSPPHRLPRLGFGTVQCQLTWGKFACQSAAAKPPTRDVASPTQDLSRGQRLHEVESKRARTAMAEVARSAF
jgi:hypothetical protein